MNCSRVTELLSAYIDSELSPDEMLEIRSHLFKCSVCDREHSILTQTRNNLSSLTRQEPSSELLGLISCRAWDVGTHTSDSRSTRQTSRLRTRWLQATAAVLCLAITAGIGLSTTNIGKVGPQANLAKSFKAEHERFQYASPLSGAPAALEAEEALDSDDQSSDTYVSPSTGFVTFVSHTTVE